MLEIRYNKTTKEITGLCGDPKQFGNLRDRGDETIVVRDIPIPDELLEALLFDNNKLIPNPDYVEPPPPRDAFAEIDTLNAKLKQAGID